MQNWRTSAIGTAAAAMYIGFKVYKGQSITVDDIMIAAGLMGVSLAAKDSSVQPTTRQVQQADIAQSKAALKASNQQ